MLKMTPYPAQLLKASPGSLPQLGDSQKVTCTAASPRGHPYWGQPQGEMDPATLAKENIFMEGKGSGRKLVTHPSNAHTTSSFHIMEKREQVEMISRRSLLLPVAWETQLISVLGGLRPLSSGKK